MTRSLALALLLPLAGRAAAPVHVYLTWQGDTASTFTVTFHTDEEYPSGEVYYDTVPHQGDYAAYKHKVTANAPLVIKGLEKRRVYIAELKDLPPGGDVYFIAGHPDRGFTAERKARTIPADATEIRFAQGGDFGTSPEVGPLLKSAASFEPAFAALGGDIAYANDILTNSPLWEKWLAFWCANMITPSGYTVPMLLAIGNHEVESGGSMKLKTRAQARFFYTYFPQGFGDVAYGMKRFGKDLAFLCLDSDHTAPSGGDQAAWLEKTLRGLAGTRHKMAMYHVPMYPSARKYEDTGAKQRAAWLPHFDALGLTCAWENHDHTYKRTQLLRNGKVDPTGIPYFGDGCWGRAVRPVNESRWYLAKAASIQHYWICDVSPSGIVARAADIKGRVFDVYPDSHPDAPAAATMLESLRRNSKNADLIASHRLPRAEQKPGLRCSVRSGVFDTLDAARAAPETSALPRAQIGPLPGDAKGPVGLVYSGYLKVDTTGEHQFWLTTDGLATVTISGFKFLDKQSPGGISARDGRLKLAEGLHPFEVAYASGEKGGLLSVEWKEPAGARGPIPAGALTHDPASTKVTRVNLPLATPQDDAEEDVKTGKVDLDSSDLELIKDKADQVVALRFTGVAIPGGAHVRAAFLQFSADEVGDDATALKIHAEAAADSAPLTKETRNLSGRTLTARVTPWIPGGWSARDSGSAQRTPNLSALVEEVTSRPDWQSGQAMTFLISGTGKRTASSFKSKEGQPARLVVEFEE